MHTELSSLCQVIFLKVPIRSKKYPPLPSPRSSVLVSLKQKKTPKNKKTQNTLAKIAWVKGLLLGELSPAFQDGEYKYTLVIIFTITGVSVLPKGVVECFTRYFLPSFSSRKCVIFFPTVFCLFSFIPKKLFFSNYNN